jgi:hypothetical protein
MVVHQEIVGRGHFGRQFFATAPKIAALQIHAPLIPLALTQTPSNSFDKKV